MEEQSLLRLQGETKSYGLSLFDRLVRMENLLNTCGLALSFNNQQHPALDKELKDNLSSLFNSVYLARPNGKYDPIVGSLERPKLEDLAARYSSVIQRSQIIVAHSDEHIPSVYMLVAVNKKQPLAGFLVAELNTSFLWGLVLSCYCLP